MKDRLLLLLDTLRSSYWFIPSLMLVGTAALAGVLVALDQRMESERLRGLWWIFSGGAEGARSLLSAVASSVIAVAGTTFSITIAVLSLTSSQFGPRLLRGFLRDTGNQIVLGTFVSTFLYCLLVLRTVRSIEETSFVPHIAVTGGVVLAIASVCVLIYFIHHVSVSIQASRIIANVAKELEESIDRLFPELIGKAASPSVTPQPAAEEEENGCAVCAETSGYVQAVEGDALLALAQEKNVLITLRNAPGQFVTRGSALAHISAPETIDEDTARRVNAAFSLGEQRTAAQDVEFIVLELVEVAVRALSPGINDPFTAIMCLDRLSAALCHLAGRALPSAPRYDAQSALRVVAKPVSFAGMVEAAFREIHHYGKDDPAVAQRLRQALKEIGECVRTEEQRAVLRKEAARLE